MEDMIWEERDCYAVLFMKNVGTYYPCQLYRINGLGGCFAQMGGGYVKLLPEGKTSDPDIKWVSATSPRASLPDDITGELVDPTRNNA